MHKTLTPPGVRLIVRDKDILESVWEQDFKDVPSAEAFLAAAGWGYVQSKACWAPRESKRIPKPYCATPIGSGLCIKTQERKPLDEVYGTPYDPVRVYAIAVYLNSDYGFVYDIVDDHQMHDFDPVLTLMTVPPLTIEAVGSWKYKEEALDAGVEYYDMVKSHFGELFDAALRANILRNYAGSRI